MRLLWPSLALFLEALGLFAVLGRRVDVLFPLRPAGPRELGRARILGVGDLMSHHDVKQAADQADGFEKLWAELCPHLAVSDLAIANLETPIAPGTGKPGVPYVFNAPADLARAVRESGFHAVATANNHAMDQGGRGLVETLEHLGRQGLVAAGSGRTPAEAEAPRILLRGGLSIALLAYTDVHYPGFQGRADRPAVSVLDVPRAAARIRDVRPKVDAVIVSVHWGNEDQTVASPRQRDAARELVAAGADLVLGHHPHVLQPVAWIEAGGRRGLVAFSLGNFISNQSRHYAGPPDAETSGDGRDGAALLCTFVKRAHPDGRVSVGLVDPHVLPLWTVNNWRDWNAGQASRREIRVIPMLPGKTGRLAQVIEARRLRAGAVLGHAVPVD